MAKSPVPTLSDLWGSRKDSSLIMQRPRSPKVEKKFSFPASSSKEDWQTVTSVVTALFQKKKLSNLELDLLTEKVKSVKLDIGNAELCKRLKESILVKGMIILREYIKVNNSGAQLLDKLASTWTHFFHNVLPIVQAIFVNLQPADGHSVRDLSLLTFRDIVVLKTKLEEAFQMGLPPPQSVIQMLLILQSVHDSTPPNKNYKRLETLVSYVVSPYLSSSGLRTKPITYSPQIESKTFGNDSTSSDSARIPRPASALQLSKGTEKLDPVMEIEHGNRRSHTITGSEDSGLIASQIMDKCNSISNAAQNINDTKM